MDFGDLGPFIRAVLAQADRNRRAEEAAYAEAEADGCLLVGGGQASPYGGGACDWEVTAFRTGEVLARGYGPIRDYEGATARVAAELGRRLIHVDQLAGKAACALDPPQPDLPGWLVCGLQELIWDNEDGFRALLAQGDLPVKPSQATLVIRASVPQVETPDPPPLRQRA